MREFLLGRSNARPFLVAGFIRRPLPWLCCWSTADRKPKQSPSHPPGPTLLATMNPAVRPVPGWIRFCQQRPEECAVSSSDPATITLTPQAWETLTRVNSQVNAAIRPMTDHEHWRVADRWDLAEDGYGDCEDYQLVKRQRLVAAGFPRRALLMTAVLDEDGAPHAVMMVRTNRGDFILDNRHNAVLPWRRTGYIYLQREVGLGSTSVSLGGAFTSSVATAGR